jgi:gamma-glutamyltranspeptidase / glutathione hydrolase
MNDEMNDFSIPHTRNEFGFVPSPINYIRPNKRPLSSITPIVVEHPNGTLYISIGAAGGSRIITSTVQALWHVLDRNLTLKEALDQPRIHDQLMPDYTTFERTDEREFGDAVVESMLERKHGVMFVGGHQSAVQGVRVMANGSFEAASDPRQHNSGGLVV